MEEIKALIEMLEKEAETIKIMINTKDCNPTAVFDAPVLTSPLNSRPVSLKGRRGIYVFMINENVEMNWNEIKNWSQLKQAGFQKWEPHTLHAESCLYLGSCWSKTGSIYCRLREHYSDNKDASGLALKHPYRNKLVDKVSVYAFPVKKELSVEEVQMIIPVIERRLHVLLNPETGSKRV